MTAMPAQIRVSIHGDILKTEGAIRGNPWPNTPPPRTAKEPTRQAAPDGNP